MKKNMLIACENREYIQGLECAFHNLENIALLPTAVNGDEAIHTILTSDVDILLLDLILPEEGGIYMLNLLDRLSEDRRPFTFVMSPVSDDRLIFPLRDKIMYCFIMPVEYEIIQLRVLEMMRTAEMQTGRLVMDLDLLEKQIAASVLAVGVPAHLKGYYYLRDAIRIYAMSESPLEISITNDVYPAVARIYNTRPQLVEHAIRNAIEIAWTRGNIDTLHAYFGYTINDCKGKPSNREFIAMMAERARSYVKKA